MDQVRVERHGLRLAHDFAERHRDDVGGLARDHLAELAPHDELFPKTKSNLEEVQARRGPVIALTNPAKPGMELRAGDMWILPEAWGPLNGFLMLPALQLFSYEAATYLGKDVDQPRNLAKSVTVE